MTKAFLERVRNGWLLFRARSIFFRLKVGVAVAYGVVVLATLGWVLPTRGPMLRNDLQARVVTLPGDPVMGRYFVVQNESSADWVGVTFGVDGGYTLERQVVLRGEKLTLFLRDFTRNEIVKTKKGSVEKSVRAPASLAVQELTIRAGRAVAVTKLRVTP